MTWHYEAIAAHHSARSSMNFFSSKKSAATVSKELEQALTDPFIPEFSDYVQKIRRNCVAISSVVLVMVYGGVTVASDLSMNGFKLKGLDDELVKTILLLLTTYWLIHFVWCAFDYLAEWRLRLTSVAPSPYTWDATQELDKADRSCTFMRWVFFQHQPAIEFSREIEEIKQMLQAADLSEAERTRLARNLDAGITAIQNIARADEGILRTLDQKMTRFEGWWGFFKNSQSLRWLLIELFAPIGFGVLAIYKLAPIVLSPYFTGLCG